MKRFADRLIVALPAALLMFLLLAIEPPVQEEPLPQDEPPVVAPEPAYAPIQLLRLRVIPEPTEFPAGYDWSVYPPKPWP